jgi:hypothetical protein
MEDEREDYIRALCAAEKFRFQQACQGISMTDEDIVNGRKKEKENAITIK